MASLRTTCPICHVMVDLHPDGVVAVATSSDTAQYSYLCPSCGQIADRTADDTATQILRTAGVEPVVVRVPHPESPANGPAFSADDVLDLHLLLATDTWFAQLTAATRAPH